MSGASNHHHYQPYISIFSGLARPTFKRTLSQASLPEGRRVAHDPAISPQSQSPRISPKIKPFEPPQSVPKGKRSQTRSGGHGDGHRPHQTPLQETFTTSHHLVPTQARSIALKLGTKRSLSGSDLPIAESASSRKRAKRPRLVDHLPLPALDGSEDLPASPLFFSNTIKNKPRPFFPSRLTSSETAGIMLSNAQGEDNVKTLNLPRGSYMSNSPPASHQSSSSRSSRPSDRWLFGRRRSSDFAGKSEQTQVLNQIGVAEVLDLDDRPVFIIDLANSTLNTDASPLEAVFANSALLSCGNLLDKLLGLVDDTSSNGFAPPFAQFKEWILRGSGDHHASSASSPPYIHGSMMWTASVLRRRFRVVSGTFLSNTSRRPSSSAAFSPPSAAAATMSPATTHMATSASLAAPGRINLNDPVAMLKYQEPPDYFGDANVSDMESVPSPIREPAQIVLQTAQPHITSTSIEPISQAENLPPSTIRVPTESKNFEWVLSGASASNLDSFSPTTSPSKGMEIFDWTRIPDVNGLPPHIRFARSVDWASTSLGPIESWGPDLRQMVNLVMASPHPAAMYWGKDLVAIYNEAYIYLAGQKHPALMGQSYRVAWAEIWDDVKEVFASAQATGQATMKDDDCLFMKRNNFLEETYFSWSIIPMVGEDGTVMGLYNPAFEKTRRKVAERRMLTLREVGERTAETRDVKGFWSAVLSALDCNEQDTPFVLLYSLASDDDSSEEVSVADSSVSNSEKRAYLEGSLGVPDGHRAAPEVMDLRNSNEGYAPVFREAMLNSNMTLVVDSEKGEVPEGLLEGLEWRGFGDPARTVLICPIHPTTGDNVLGFLVMGVNPRRPYDDDYNLYIQLLSRQLATSLASVVLFEEEIRRGQRAAKMAALDRINLSQQLAARTQEAIESETKFTRMAEFAPVGMFIANSEGEITYCNDTWYEITRVPKKDQPAENWVDFVLDEDMPLVRQLLRDLVENTKPASQEFRFKAPWIDRSGVSGETWVLFSAYPEPNEDGSLKSVFGSMTNISSQKWAEGLQKKKMEEAVEIKRQQENFIDITSHELRNPLSAILQCADEIVTTLSEARSGRDGDDIALFDNSIDAAQTISLCAQHQKRIVDDVLTMSKIDSALLMVTPVDVQPLGIVQRALKMFEGELSSADITMDFQVDESFKRLGVNWMRCDPSRTTQILINILTNAIKFTTKEKKRTITVTIAASLTHPSDDANTVVKYVPKRANRIDTTTTGDWGTGEIVFLQFAVKDTGRGLSDEEKKSLFLRFSQASPRTHVQYGGSGLGLFISRELTELQGGEIGVASVAGEGSTFAFFVKARRSVRPADPLETLPTGLVSRRQSSGKSTARRPLIAAAAPQVRDFGKEPLKILLVEDNLVNQRVLQKQLENLGCQVTVANHGGEALEWIKKSKFWRDNTQGLDIRVVLMDQEMPVMDGVTCTEMIRGHEKSGEIAGHVPIVGITANARSEQIEKLYSAGMDDVVSKPFRVTEIIPKVEELTARYRPPQQQQEKSPGKTAATA